MNLFIEIIFLSINEETPSINDVFSSFIFFPITAILGGAVDRLFPWDVHLFVYISIIFYPLFCIGFLFKNKLYNLLGEFFYVAFGILFLLASLIPIHRLWAFMSV